MFSARHFVFLGFVGASLLLVAVTQGLPLTPAVAQASQGLPTGEPSSISDVAIPPRDCSLPGTLPASVLRWCAPIEQAAAETNLDPTLVGAIIWVESGGDASAVSASGAIGLMQVMPRDGAASTFQCVNGPCFASRPSTAELMDPAFNLHYGTALLAGLVESKGSLREALRAYGPMDQGYRYADMVLAAYGKR
jgi:soluble lytic murein transglycosylase-like protein